MLPLWRNRLFIALSPERVSVLKLGRGFKPALLAQHDEAVAMQAGQPLWQAACERLAALLAQPEWQHADVEIVLSNRLVRYAVIPFSPQLKKYAQQEAFARHVLAPTYGSASAQWELRIQSVQTDTPWLVSAMDRDLLETLRKICAESQLRLRGVFPYLMPVFNRYHKVLRADPAWLVIGEPDCSLFALLGKGGVIAVSSVKQDAGGDLPLLLDRENLASALPEPCKSVYLHAPMAGSLPVLDKSGYTVNSLALPQPEGFPVPSEGLYAMAMSGVR